MGLLITTYSIDSFSFNSFSAPSGRSKILNSESGAISVVQYCLDPPDCGFLLMNEMPSATVALYHAHALGLLFCQLNI